MGKDNEIEYPKDVMIESYYALTEYLMSNESKEKLKKVENLVRLGVPLDTDQLKEIYHDIFMIGYCCRKKEDDEKNLKKIN